MGIIIKAESINLTRFGGFAIRWCRVWGFAIPVIYSSVSHHKLVLLAKIMNL